MFATKAEAQKAGWFSRRHETRDANDEAREAYGTRATRRMRRQVSAQARAHVTSLMHPQARLALIEGRPGNSKRERTRLLAQIEKG